MNLAQHFEGLIAADWKIGREGSFWTVLEPGSNHSLFEIGGARSMAFSLDQKHLDRFPFFSQTAPKGLRQANDAILIADVEGLSYIIAIEMKNSLADKSKALKQIESGRCFVHWIEQLLRLHGHWSGESQFCGLISLKPRRQVRKGLTRRSAELPNPEPSPHGPYSVFVLANHPRVSVHDLIKQLERAA